MSDFCKPCTADVFGEEFAEKNDMAGLCKEDEMAGVLCEHCGFIQVDSKGDCLTHRNEDGTYNHPEEDDE